MFGEYINMGLMILILGATFWILRSPKKKADADNGENDTDRISDKTKPKGE
jgi:hypothetical protein